MLQLWIRCWMLVSACPPSASPQARRTGILDFKRKLSLFIQHQVSSIQYLANCGINDRFHDVVIFGSGLSGLGPYLIISFPNWSQS